MTEITRSEAERALAEAEIDSMEPEEVVEALKRFYMYGYEENVPYCEMTNDEIIDQYEEVFDELISLI